MSEYIKEILGNVAAAGQRRRGLQHVDAMACAFCQGSGVNPAFGNQSVCGVCHGRGRVAVQPPVVSCLKCRGSGCETGDLTCLACRGYGVVAVRPGAGACPRCRGTGEDGVFYCTQCKGQGIC